MKKILLVAIVLFLGASANAQDKYFTKNGTITFDATTSTSPEKVAAVNKSVTCVLDSKTGNTQFSVLMKGFEFEQALMREHFHENYLESEKFPKALFKGQIINPSQINYSKNGIYDVNVKGQLTIHGQTKDVETNGKVSVNDGKISIAAKFAVLLNDYGIEVPRLVSDKLAKSASIKVDCSLQVLGN
ncbi:MAG TPA: YceI family protein [Daejeonella sp.]|jgi:polyisoprenoid-binding protein YceI|uniref:YceI family protein n=1 Tax=Daejeonella sp. TaxID=2805397 RepID=UPI002ED7B4BB